ncbi:MAG TPA: hypothetical protein VE860_28655 [Chthoniobacterales bacterium]|jgi:hypothetical protein|nr:hypothetical protein [Chthoniobacterales bacterium]
MADRSGDYEVRQEEQMRERVAYMTREHPEILLEARKVAAMPFFTSDQYKDQGDWIREHIGSGFRSCDLLECALVNEFLLINKKTNDRWGRDTVKPLKQAA